MIRFITRLFQKRTIGALPVASTSESHISGISLIEQIRKQKLTYLSGAKLASIETTCRNIESQKLPGVFIEAGCALGGSSILIASTKASQRPFFVYDVFGMIPPPTTEDTPEVHERYRTIVDGKSKGISGDKYYGYVENLYEVVQSNFSRFGINPEAASVTLIKGLVQDTLHPEQEIAFAHIDVDWYDPVMTCLSRIFPRLVVGGSMIFDDYNAWGGCRKAVDEYLQTVPGQFSADNALGPMKITRTRAA